MLLSVDNESLIKLVVIKPTNKSFTSKQFDFYFLTLCMHINNLLSITSTPVTHASML